MGCNVSRVEANGVSLPARLLPIFPMRLGQIRHRKHGTPLKDPTPSQKNLLLHKDEDDYASIRSSIASRTLASSLQDSIRNPNLVEQKQKEIGFRDDENDDEGSLKKCTKNDTKDSPREEGNAKIEEAVTDDEEDDDNDDKRMIGYEDDKSCPGSPSFRVYFHENGEDESNDIGKTNNIGASRETTVSSNCDGLSSKGSSDPDKKVKRGRKKRSFVKILPKGGQAAVKNLLKVKSCCTSTRSSRDHAHLLRTKTST
ncbi:uncharacterized protein LOC105158165 isoform X2 [Sesamum indicum]|uniref:Uncharacterized protein LOC105158165 isoform X2 n=1 Tax=Sesamum indicum TaxID=4182 RepID=A0A6I9SZ65_SESIN|nr:uncharacterized protein LOC105158165 isoform X2 [Sesamum indicum]